MNLFFSKNVAGWSEKCRQRHPEEVVAHLAPGLLAFGRLPQALASHSRRYSVEPDERQFLAGAEFLKGFYALTVVGLRTCCCVFFVVFLPGGRGVLLVFFGRRHTLAGGFCECQLQLVLSLDIQLHLLRR